MSYTGSDITRPSALTGELRTNGDIEKPAEERYDGQVDEKPVLEAAYIVSSRKNLPNPCRELELT
jgi:hypothetical protein